MPALNKDDSRLKAELEQRELMLAVEVAELNRREAALRRAEQQRAGAGETVGAELVAARAELEARANQVVEVEQRITSEAERLRHVQSQLAAERTAMSAQVVALERREEAVAEAERALVEARARLGASEQALEAGRLEVEQAEEHVLERERAAAAAERASVAEAERARAAEEARRERSAVVEGERNAAAERAQKRERVFAAEVVTQAPRPSAAGTHADLDERRDEQSTALEFAPVRSHGGLDEWPSRPVPGWSGPGESDWWAKMLGRPLSDAANVA